MKHILTAALLALAPMAQAQAASLCPNFVMPSGSDEVTAAIQAKQADIHARIEADDWITEADRIAFTQELTLLQEEIRQNTLVLIDAFQTQCMPGH